MANDEFDDQQESKKLSYPLDPNSYLLLEEIGRGLNAIVYKATCNSSTTATTVAIKSIDLDRSRADFENVRREAKTMSLLSHPNILKAHCSFIVDRRLWVVTPFMSGGSLQSIMASSFPTGLTEPCIAVVLKEALMGLCYLHDQGHLHRDIKAGNILIDSNGSIKLADFGVSASVYESINPSSFLLNEVTGTPYWMAPEVIHSHTGYSYKADIWSFGITALELAHGRPPLSHLPFSKSILMKITKRFRFSDYGKDQDGSKNRKFSKAFKDMVGLCLDQDPSKRPCTEKLLKHPFFKNCKGSDFLVKNVLQGLPSVEERFRETKLKRLGSMSRSEDGDDESGEGVLLGTNVKQSRISGWNFNLEGFELEPVFPSDKSGELDDILKQVRFGGETVILERAWDQSDVSSASSPGQVVCKPEAICGVGVGGGVDKDMVMGNLMALKRSLDDQREKVLIMINLMGGEEVGLEVSREEQLIQVIEKLRKELEMEKRKNSELMLEMEFLKLQVASFSEI